METTDISNSGSQPEIPLDDAIEIVKECAEKFYKRNFLYYGSVDLNPILQGYGDSIIANLRKTYKQSLKTFC